MSQPTRSLQILTHTIQQWSDSNYRVAVTGHRNLGNQAIVQFVTESFHTILTQIHQQHPAHVVALSGLAEGADTLFAEVALELRIPLESVIAYQGLEADFSPGPTRSRFLRLKALSQKVYQLPYTTRSNTAYLAMGQHLVDRCHMLVAAWNGLPAAGKGGTGDIVYYAREKGLPVVHIHTVQQTICVLS